MSGSDAVDGSPPARECHGWQLRPPRFGGTIHANDQRDDEHGAALA